MTERIVFACSGSENVSVAIPALAGGHGAEIVTLTLDVGQDHELEEVHDRALRSGAVRAHVIDVRDEFAHEFVLPVLHNGMLKNGAEPITFPLAQAIIGKKLVEMALIEDATAVAHHCHGLDRMRIENSVSALNAKLRVIAFDREASRSLSTHSNLWGRAVDYDVSGNPPEPPYSWTRPSNAAPETGADVEIEFERGLPVAINGVPLDLAELIESVAVIAGQHGVGRIAPGHDAMRPGESRRIYEVPAATVLHAAHAALELESGTRDVLQLKQQFRHKYVELVVQGRWFTQVREALDAFSSVVQRHVNGTVRVQLRKGECTVLDVHHRQSGAAARDYDTQESASASPIAHPRVAARRR